MDQLRVFVYRDQGVGPFSYREALGSLIDILGSAADVQPIDSARIRAGDWIEQTALLVFPGGRDVPYDAALRGEGNAQVRRFVEEGGSYLGLCAGAYYGAAEVVFQRGGPLEVIGKRELAFFPGQAYGPVYAADKFVYDKEDGTVAAPLMFGDQTLRAYYNGGCAFASPERYADRVTIMGHYTDLGTAAIVACQVGKGLAILSGCHIEYRLSSLDRLALPDSVRQQLAESEPVRQQIFRDVIGYMVARGAVKS